MTEKIPVQITQSVAILIDGNNIERSLHTMTNSSAVMLNFDSIIPKLLNGRGLSRLIYFREGKAISSKLAQRLLSNYHGSVVPCHKSADIPLTINATQIAKKVDTIIILSGDSDYVELVRHLKGEGVRVEIAAIEKTAASILLDEADHFVPITKEDSFGLPSGKPSSRRIVRKSSQDKPSETKKESKPVKPPVIKEKKKQVEEHNTVSSSTNQADAYFLLNQAKKKEKAAASNKSNSRNTKKESNSVDDKVAKKTPSRNTRKSSSNRKSTAKSSNRKTANTSQKPTKKETTESPKSSKKSSTSRRKRPPRKTK